MEKEFTVKTPNGSDLKIVSKQADGITNRISCGGDKRGYYIVVRGKNHTEILNALEQIYKGYEHSIICALKDIANKKDVH